MVQDQPNWVRSTETRTNPTSQRSSYGTFLLGRIAACIRKASDGHLRLAVRMSYFIELDILENILEDWDGVEHIDEKSFARIR
jgi:hypothetical protein